MCRLDLKLGMGSHWAGCYFCTKDYFVSTKHAINYKLKALGPFTARPCCCAWLRVKSSIEPTAATTATTTTGDTKSGQQNLKDNNLSLQADSNWNRQETNAVRERAMLVYMDTGKKLLLLFIWQSLRQHHYLFCKLSSMVRNPKSKRSLTTVVVVFRSAFDSRSMCLQGNSEAAPRCKCVSSAHTHHQPPTPTH